MLKVYRRGEFKGLKKGPWDSEPDTIEWVFKNSLCKIIRNSLGSLCGYACVYPGHPGFGEHYNHVEYSAHGGLTFSGPEIGQTHHMNNDSEIWYFGFDCAHAGDLVPYIGSFSSIPKLSLSFEKYKDIGYVLTETEQLASQLMLKKCDCGHLYENHVFNACSHGCECINYFKTREILDI
jgi:hypothetical protein